MKINGFIRTYTRGGKELKCLVMCNVRGPLISYVEGFDLADTTCPECLLLVTTE